MVEENRHIHKSCCILVFHAYILKELIFMQTQLHEQFAFCNSNTLHFTWGKQLQLMFCNFALSPCSFSVVSTIHIMSS